MKKNIQKNLAQALLWSLLLNAFLPAGMLAKDKDCRPDKTVVTADAVRTDTLHVKCDAKVGSLKVRGDAVVGGDLTVKGRIHGNCPERTADYIIIGVGGAGAVLAKRLTDDRKHSVIALEAGENNSEDPAIKFPENGYLQLLPNYNPQYFWQGQTVPEPQIDDAVFYYSSGRLLGGGTSINGMQYVWGSDNYWAKIEALLGADWSVDKVHKRYKKMETYTAPFPASPARGTHGLWDNVAIPFQPNDTDEYLFNAFAAVSGMPSILDFNDPSTPNGQFIQYDTSEQPTSPAYLRESSNTAFLSEDIMTQDGIGVNGRQLRVHLRATVLDLLWDNDRVVGVRYTKDGESFEIYANKEVILCAGFQSAQFLQRNGIGPKDVLDAAGVRVRVDSPLCGQLVNHVYCSAVVLMPPNSRLTPENEPWAVWGPGTMYPQITPPADPNNTIRDVQIITADLGNDLALFAVGLMDPQSVGYVNIQNDDPLKIPLANPNLLAEQADVDVLVNSYQHFMLDLLDYFDANPQEDKGNWIFLSPTREQIVDTAQLEEFLRSVASQAHHYCCQCPAGTSLENGVVDTYGRVFGVKGLRVADVSILPIIPDGNTGTPAGLIGWTISDFILAGK